MRQISEFDLRFILGFELMQTGKGIRTNLGSGHQETARRARDAIVDRLMQRMATWEILVPEPAPTSTDKTANWKGERGCTTD